MIRYFLEVSYKGNKYAGFQVQQNALTVQGEMERALEVFFRRRIVLTGSSRTDAGVHALQNFFHFDSEEVDPRAMYNLNAILPSDIAVSGIYKMRDDAHARFNAVWRQYRYAVHTKKEPFITDTSYHFPFTIDLGLMQTAAEMVIGYTNFSAFAKRNSQVKTHNCTIFESEWSRVGSGYEYVVRANRFLRGMVRGLVGTMLQVGRERISIEDFRMIIEKGDQSAVDFSVPGYGLCLEKVGFPDGFIG